MALTVPQDDVDEHADEHNHDLRYIKIAGILAFLTAVEVGMFFVEETVPNAVLFAGLSVLMVVKFAVVAAYFMHLKYDTRWFTYLFVAGLVLAIVVYLIFFLAFDFFGLGGGANDFAS